MVARLNSVKIDLRGIILLEAEGKQNLLDFSEAGLLEVNYADYLEEVTQIHASRGQHLESQTSCTILLFCGLKSYGLEI